MKSKFHLAISLLLAFLSCLSLHCKKESELDKLPPATTSGKQTFGCLVNGKAFVVTDFYLDNAGNNEGYFNHNLSTLFFDTYNQEAQGGNISFYSKNIIKQPGEYLISFEDLSQSVFYYSGSEGNYRSVYTPKGLAYLRITNLDPINGYISGQFDFTLFNQSGTKSVHISNGRFDIRY